MLKTASIVVFAVLMISAKASAVPCTDPRGIGGLNDLKLVESVGKAEIYYQQRHHRNIAVVQIYVSGSADDKESLSLCFWQVTSASPPGEVHIAIQYISSAPKFYDHNKIKLLVDGEEFDVDSLFYRHTEGNYSYEKYGRDIEYALFQKLLAGRDVVFILGRTRFSATPSIIEGMKDVDKAFTFQAANLSTP